MMKKKLLALSLMVALIGLTLPPAQADDTDIFGTNIQPNVLLAMDDSEHERPDLRDPLRSHASLRGG